MKNISIVKKLLIPITGFTFIFMNGISLASNLDKITYRPKIIILTAFPPEYNPWIKVLRPTLHIKIHGVPSGLECDSRLVCVVDTHEGSENTAMSVTHIVESTNLNVEKTIFIRAGIAGGVLNRSAPALGSVYLANWVCSWGFGYHYLSKNGIPSWTPTKPPYANNGWQTLSFRVDPNLLKKALSFARHAQLENSKIDKYLDGIYHIRDDIPRVLSGANVSGDDFWIGSKYQDIAVKIVKTYTKGQADYGTTAMEELGDLTALSSVGLARHYLSVRGTGNYDVNSRFSVSQIVHMHKSRWELAANVAIHNEVAVTQAIIRGLLSEGR